ncbi:MAG: hypothetical protein QOD50_326 [Actinomycetota bacterium]|nr:hypothetical protein [Actinomycetota bacterium]
MVCVPRIGGTGHAQSRCAGHQLVTPARHTDPVARDIYVQDIPFDANSVGDIPDDFEPLPLAYTPEQVREVIAAAAPGIEFDSAGWATYETDGIDLEVSVEDSEPFESFAFVDRSSNRAAVDDLIRSILDTLDLRAFDVDSDGGIFR